MCIDIGARICLHFARQVLCNDRCIHFLILLGTFQKIHAQHVRNTYTTHTQHIACATHAQHIHNTDTTLTQHIHNTYTTHTHHIHNTCTTCTQRLHNKYTTHTQHIHMTDGYRVLSLEKYTTHTQHIHNTYTILTQQI